MSRRARQHVNGLVGLLLAIAPLTSSAECKTITLRDAVQSDTIRIIPDGDHEIEFQSLYGNDCRQYRMRNKPGARGIPVRWQYGETVFLDRTLAPCKRREECRWSEKEIPSSKQKLDLTQIRFSLNNVEYVATAYAWVEAPTLSDSLAPADKLVAMMPRTVTARVFHPYNWGARLNSAIDD